MDNIDWTQMSRTYLVLVSVIGEGGIMSTRNKSGLFKAGLLVVLSALPALGSATHSWGGYHWANSLNPINSPFTIQLGDNVSDKWKRFLTAASTDWTVSSRFDISGVQGGARNAKRCTPTAGRVEVCSNLYGNNGWLGVAQVWLSGSHITQGTVKLNDSYFNTAKYNQDGWRRLVMCQEIGHTFGLDHQDETFANANLGTCMDYTDDPDGKLKTQLSNEQPNQHDYAELESIYNHADSTNSAQTASPGSPSATGEVSRSTGIGTAEWGRLIRSSNGGRTERFVLDHGNGQKVVTFVIWAD